MSDNEPQRNTQLVEVRHDANIQRMYVHEVVLNAPTTAFKTAAEVPDGSKLHSANRGAIFSLLQKLRDVKSSKVVDENGEDGYDDIKAQPRGTNQTSLIYSREFPDGKIEYVERVFETSEKHKPRLVTKTVWVKVTTGVKPSPTQVYNPDHHFNLLFKDGHVNQDSVSKVVDENGKPLVVYHRTKSRKAR
jgi:hypothetical protein